LKFTWEPAARADLRRLDRDTAMRILVALTRYGLSGEGDVKQLTDREGLCRLRLGKWRVFFDLDSDGTLKVSARDMETGQKQSITVSAYSYLTDSEIQSMIDDNREYALEQEHDEMLLRVRASVEGHLRFVESRLPALQARFTGNPQNQKALERIVGVAKSARQALEDGSDAARLMELETYLQKTREILESGVGSP